MSLNSLSYTGYIILDWLPIAVAIGGGLFIRSFVRSFDYSFVIIILGGAAFLEIFLLERSTIFCEEGFDCFDIGTKARLTNCSIDDDIDIMCYKFAFKVWLLLWAF